MGHALLAFSGAVVGGFLGALLNIYVVWPLMRRFWP